MLWVVGLGAGGPWPCEPLPPPTGQRGPVEAQRHSHAGQLRRLPRPPGGRPAPQHHPVCASRWARVWGHCDQLRAPLWHQLHRQRAVSPWGCGAALGHGGLIPCVCPQLGLWTQVTHFLAVWPQPGCCASLCLCASTCRQEGAPALPRVCKGGTGKSRGGSAAYSCRAILSRRSLSLAGPKELELEGTAGLLEEAGLRGVLAHGGAHSRRGSRGGGCRRRPGCVLWLEGAAWSPMVPPRTRGCPPPCPAALLTQGWRCVKRGSGPRWVLARHPTSWRS